MSICYKKLPYDLYCQCLWYEKQVCLFVNLPLDIWYYIAFELCDNKEYASVALALVRAIPELENVLLSIERRTKFYIDHGLVSLKRQSKWKPGVGRCYITTECFFTSDNVRVFTHSVYYNSNNRIAVSQNWQDKCVIVKRRNLLLLHVNKKENIYSVRFNNVMVPVEQKLFQQQFQHYTGHSLAYHNFVVTFCKPFINCIDLSLYILKFSARNG